MKFYLLILLMLSVGLKLHAQHIYVKVLSATENTPLVYANVFFIKHHFGTITNEDGTFEFDKQYVINDTIVISHIGFEQFKCAVSDIDAQILLTPISINLNEILVLSKNIKQIVEKSCNLVPINYPTTPQSYLISINHIISTDSLILSIFDGNIICSTQSYSKRKPCEYRLYDVKSFQNNRNTVEYTISYKSSAFPNNLIEQLYVSDLDFVTNTKYYEYVEVESPNNNYYTIDFKPINADSKHPYKGRITINKADLAFVNISYSVVAPNLLIQKDVTIDLGHFSKTEELHSVESSKTELHFVKYNGKYHLSHFYNEYFYTHQSSNNKQTHYLAKNEIVNQFGSFNQISEYKPISLYLYDLKEWNYDVQNHNSVISKYYSKRINKIQKQLKEKYPDMNFDEFND